MLNWLCGCVRSDTPHTHAHAHTHSSGKKSSRSSGCGGRCFKVSSKHTCYNNWQITNTQKMKGMTHQYWCCHDNQIWDCYNIQYINGIYYHVWFACHLSGLLVYLFIVIKSCLICQVISITINIIFFKYIWMKKTQLKYKNKTFKKSDKKMQIAFNTWLLIIDQVLVNLAMWSSQFRVFVQIKWHMLEPGTHRRSCCFCDMVHRGSQVTSGVTTLGVSQGCGRLGIYSSTILTHCGQDFVQSNPNLFI